MIRDILFLVLFSLLIACQNQKDSSNFGEYVDRGSQFEVFCVEKLIADSTAWTLTFDQGRVKTQGEVLTLSSLNQPYEIELNEEKSSHLGLPYGEYKGVRQEDAQTVHISIHSLDWEATRSFGKRHYNGSITGNNRHNEVSCYDK